MDAVWQAVVAVAMVMALVRVGMLVFDIFTCGSQIAQLRERIEKMERKP